MWPYLEKESSQMQLRIFRYDHPGCRVNAKSNNKSPYNKKRHRQERRNTEERPCQDRGRNRIMLPQPRNAWSHQKLEETRKISPLEPSEGVWSCNTLISNFWPLEQWMDNFCCFKPSSLWYKFWLTSPVRGRGAFTGKDNSAECRSWGPQLLWELAPCSHYYSQDPFRINALTFTEETLRPQEFNLLCNSATHRMRLGV